MWVSFLYLQCCLLCFLVSPPFFFPPDSPVPPKYCLPSSWLFFLLNQPEWCILTVYKRLFHSIFLPRVSKYKQNPMVVCTDWGTWQGEARSWQSVSHRKSLSCSFIFSPPFPTNSVHSAVVSHPYWLYDNVLKPSSDCNENHLVRFESKFSRNF